MGSHARMLAALGAVLTFTLSIAGSAGASMSLVRVEGAGAWATSVGALVDRVAVEHTTSYEMTADGHTATCAPDSPVALLDQAVGPAGWSGELLAPAAEGGPYGIRLTSIRSVPAGAGAAWVAFLSSKWTRDVCNSHVADTFEVVFYPLCDSPTPATRQDTCYAGGPLSMRIGEGTWYETRTQTITSGNSPVTVEVLDTKVTDRSGFAQSPLSATDTTVVNDQDYSATTKGTQEDSRNGFAIVRFTTLGDHWIRANAPGRVPVRLKVCSTDGQDGHCGTLEPDVNTTPPPGGPGACVTNGHDGQCGTIDTTGPPTHVKEIRQNQVFARRKGPSRLTGTVDVDGSGIKDVRLRLTRVTTARVIVKPKPKKKARRKTAKASSVASAAATKKKPRKKKVRYRTVKRCTYWSNATLLFEKAKKCGTKHGKWWEADLADVPTAFSYSFEMKLPAGTYVLELQARDVDGHPELAEPGRNVLTFTVK